MTDYTKLAREIVEKNQYMTIGSSNSDGTAWVSPVAYAYDKDWNFYFASIDSSKHCQNLLKNNIVSVAIFDSCQKWGYGIGLQIEGGVTKVGLSEIPKAIKIYFSRKWPYGEITGSFAKSFKKLLKIRTYEFYKITPTKFWMGDPDSEVDVRVEVKL